MHLRHVNDCAELRAILVLSLAAEPTAIIICSFSLKKKKTGQTHTIQDIFFKHGVHICTYVMSAAEGTEPKRLATENTKLNALPLSYSKWFHDN